MKSKRITIIGLGLIGGSLGLAFKDGGGAGVRVTGVDDDLPTLQQAMACGAVDDSTKDLVAGVQHADVIFLCTPVLQIVPIVEKILPYLQPGTILTDVGSTKVFLREQLSALLPDNIHYVSGHPMAGGEQSGVLAAKKDLFRDKWYILIQGAAMCYTAVAEVSKILEWTGARLTTMDIVEHDRCVAVISHIPHVAAAALVNLLALYPDFEDNFKLVGGGFRDTTRIAASNADMWADICLTNRMPIVDSLVRLQTLLDEVIQGVRTGDRQVIHHFFKRAKLRRDALITKTDSHAIF